MKTESQDSVAVEKGKLSPAERKQFRELLDVFHGGAGKMNEGALECGSALREIRDARLYRETHPTFEGFIREVLGIQRAQAYRLIRYAEDVAVLSPTGDIPNERQVRELARLRDRPEEMKVVWEEASSEGRKPTAASVREAVNARLKEPEEALDSALHEQAKQARDYSQALVRAREHGRKKRKRPVEYPPPPHGSLKPLLELAQRGYLHPIESVIDRLSDEEDSTLLAAMRAVVRSPDLAESYVAALIDAETDAKMPEPQTTS